MSLSSAWAERSRKNKKSWLEEKRKKTEVEKCGVWRVEKELGGWTEKKSGREKDEEGEHQTPAGLIHLSPLPSPQGV